MWRLLQLSRHNLSPQRAFVLDGVLKNNPLISAAWHCKEGFYDIWGYEERPSRHDAEMKFKVWKDAIPDEVSEFRSVAQTVERWHDKVFAYFDHPFTNAYTEAANGLVKHVNRAGRGYRFNTIRARAITMPSRAREAWFVCEHCLGQYERLVDAIYAPRFSKIEMDLHPKAIALCPRCSRFHVSEWVQHVGRSTRKSG